jgi:hypothetical protein
MAGLSLMGWDGADPVLSIQACCIVNQPFQFVVNALLLRLCRINPIVLLAISGFYV